MTCNKVVVFMYFILMWLEKMSNYGIMNTIVIIFQERQ